MSPSLGKALIVVGLLLVVGGAGILFDSKLNIIGRLPGDLRIERDNFTLFVPLGTCLLFSALFSLIFWLFRR